MRDANRPWILGIGASHNGAACLLHGDELAVAIQEERLVRMKRADHPAALASLAINYCLDTAGITPADLSAVGVCTFADDPLRDDVTLNPQLRVQANGIAVVPLTHHLGHAVGAYATSGFENAAVLVVDGNGSPLESLGEQEARSVLPSQRARFRDNPGSAWEIISLYTAQGTCVVPIEKHVGASPKRAVPAKGLQPFWSLGRLFENIGALMFGQPLDGPGKVMGLAAHGRPTIPVDMFFDIAGDEIVFRVDLVERFPGNDRWPKCREEYADLAASAQAALEEALLWLLRRLRRTADARYLCYAGGVALNSVANERLFRERCFDDIFIMPAAEDSGTAIGAAYHALWQTRQPSTRTYVRSVRDSHGSSYDRREITAAVRRHPGLTATHSRDVAEAAAEFLVGGHVVGWFQDGAELGPRALGQRSMLADPRPPGMKELLDSRVKFREPFRPYAPAVLIEDLDEWFEVDPDHRDSPFMLRVMPFRPELRHRVPAVVHADGTGRVQTVSAASNPRLHALLRAFRERTGVPILLNTSFNVAGEPIVETPDDALWCFELAAMKACVIGDYVVTKTAQEHSVLDCYPRTTRGLRWEEHFRDAKCQTVRLDTFGRRLWVSVAEGHLSYVEGVFRAQPSDHIRFTVAGRWGRMIHMASPDVAQILGMMTGRQSARAILAAVNDAGMPYTETEFITLLRRLSIARIVELRPPALSATMASTSNQTYESKLP